MRKVAIIQSSYLPWKGYFDIIHDVDTFVFYDCVQFTKRDWRTRNYIKTPTGRQLIFVPVHGTTTLPINQITVDNSTRWAERHLQSLERNYCHSEYFDQYRFLLDEFYRERRWSSLSELNQYVIKRISEILGIKTMFIDSQELQLKGAKTERLINALTKLTADLYVSGPAAQNYLKPEQFEQAGITLIYKDYSNYPTYPQRWGEFAHQVCILDLLFNTGKKAPDYIWGWRSKIPEGLRKSYKEQIK